MYKSILLIKFAKNLKKSFTKKILIQKSSSHLFFTPLKHQKLNFTHLNSNLMRSDVEGWKNREEK